MARHPLSLAILLACLHCAGAQTPAAKEHLAEKTAAAPMQATPAATQHSETALAAKSAQMSSDQRTYRFNVSASQIQDSQARTEALLARLLELRKQNPRSASQLNPSIERLQLLLQHLRDLSTHTEALRPQSKISDAPVIAHHHSTPPTETAVASITALSSDAQATQAEAERITQAATEQAATGAGASGSSSGSRATPPPPPAPVVEQPAPEPQPAPSPKKGVGAPTESAPKQPQQAPPPVVSSSGPPAASDTEDPEAAWFAKLKSGILQYSVPTDMKWKVPSTVTVVLNGARAAAPAPLPGQTQQAPLKVSRQMRVIVSCPENPDEFTIAPEAGTQEIQFVPEDGITTWNYSVTPRYTGRNQHIRVQAFVVYAADTQRQLPVYDAAVTVHVPGFGESLKRLLEGDPDYWLKYGLPGGAGFVFVSGAIAGLRKLLKKKEPAAPPPVKTAS